MIGRMRRAMLGSFARVLPDRAADRFEREMLAPARAPAPAPDAPGARHRRVPGGSGWLHALEWGDGPTVLLMHGWSGRASDLAALVPPLVAAGFRVVAYDAPAHGASDGERTHIVECAGAAVLMGGLAGPVWGVVAHSFGALATAYALHHGLWAQRLVFIGPPRDLAALAALRARRAGVPGHVVERANERLAERLGVAWDDLLTDRLMATLHLPLVVIHDRQDASVPYADGHAIAAAAPRGRLFSTSGLGHHQVLRDARVLEEIVGFLRGTPAQAVRQAAD